MTPEQALPLLTALANARRLTVLRALALSGGSSAVLLSPMLDIPEAQVTGVLTELLNAGLVLKQRSGRHVFYGVNHNTIADLITFLQQEL